MDASCAGDIPSRGVSPPGESHLESPARIRAPNRKALKSAARCPHGRVLAALTTAAPADIERLQLMSAACNATAA
jgi:hypothetical protein